MLCTSSGLCRASGDIRIVCTSHNFDVESEVNDSSFAVMDSCTYVTSPPFCPPIFFKFAEYLVVINFELVGLMFVVEPAFLECYYVYCEVV